MIFMMAIEQDYDEIDMAIRQFQEYHDAGVLPVYLWCWSAWTCVGGGCEMSLHADKVITLPQKHIPAWWKRESV